MTINKGKQNQIELIFSKFLSNRIKTVRKLKLADLDINPFLIRILSQEIGLKCQDIVHWFLCHEIVH